jgi:hypothetical protein
MEIGANREASRTPAQFSQGWGALQRFLPVGGAAKGIPLNAVMRGSAASIPRTHPFSVFTCLSIGLFLLP